MNNNRGMIKRGPQWHDGADTGYACIEYRNYRIKAFFSRDSQGRPVLSLKFDPADTLATYLKRRARYYLGTAWRKIKNGIGYTKAKRTLKQWRKRHAH